MHDPRTLLEAGAVTALGRRGYRLDSAHLRELVDRRAELGKERDALRAELNRSSRAVRRGRSGGDAADQEGDEAGRRAQARADRERLRKLDEELRQCRHELRELLLAVPNVLADETPDGDEADPPVERHYWGDRPEFDFTPRDHVELGVALGVLDPTRAAKLSGARFAVTRGAGARLERALASFLLDLHTREHGYVEHGVPHLVNAETMTGTGQLPKFAADLFHTSVGERDLLLIPTAEVPLVNLYRDELIDAAALPLALVAHTPCYRSEAGSYGRDVRGLVRLHQFDKVELVRLCHPDEAAAELELLLAHAETALRLLGLHYRVVDLRAGDLGFAARRTYDIEVWLPGQAAYREISSCSDCGAFQARRAGIRVRQRDGRKTYAATLNGSALPIGRTLVAILEQYQRADGAVVIPPVLTDYAGFSAIDPTGAAADGLGSLGETGKGRFVRRDSVPIKMS